jgi:myo-inositol-1(or 4)-monophosphatase
MDVHDWLALFKEIGLEAHEKAARLYGTSEAGRELGVGAGGDVTVMMDKVIEEVVAHACNKIGDVRLISEELGLLEFGEPSATVIADPLDGSFNAKMGIPLYTISLAFAERGMELGDISLGYVRNLVNGDEYHAIRGEGAFLNGGPIRSSNNNEILVLGMEPHPNTELALRQNLAIVEKDTRVRSLGCISIDLCHVANGIFDTFVDVRGKATRIVDISAGKIIVEEAGGLITDEKGRALDNVPIGLDNRVNFIASGNRTIHGKVISTLTDKGFIER